MVVIKHKLDLALLQAYCECGSEKMLTYLGMLTPPEQTTYIYACGGCGKLHSGKEFFSKLVFTEGNGAAIDIMTEDFNRFIHDVAREQLAGVVSLGFFSMVDHKKEDEKENMEEAV